MVCSCPLWSIWLPHESRFGRIKLVVDKRQTLINLFTPIYSRTVIINKLFQTIRLLVIFVPFTTYKRDPLVTFRLLVEGLGKINIVTRLENRLIIQGTFTLS